MKSPPRVTDETSGKHPQLSSSEARKKESATILTVIKLHHGFISTFQQQPSNRLSFYAVGRLRGIHTWEMNSFSQFRKASVSRSQPLVAAVEFSIPSVPICKDVAPDGNMAGTGSVQKFLPN